MNVRVVGYAALCWLVGCGAASTNTGENFGDLLTSPAGLVLTGAEHPGGWGRTDCDTCHNLGNLHLVNHSAIAIDIAAVHDQAIQNGNAGCIACHGANGVQ